MIVSKKLNAIQNVKPVIKIYFTSFLATVSLKASDFPKIDAQKSKVSSETTNQHPSDKEWKTQNLNGFG